MGKHTSEHLDQVWCLSYSLLVISAWSAAKLHLLCSSALFIRPGGGVPSSTMWMCLLFPGFICIPSVCLSVCLDVRQDSEVHDVEPLINQDVRGEAGMGSARWPFLKISF